MDGCAKPKSSKNELKKKRKINGNRKHKKKLINQKN